MQKLATSIMKFFIPQGRSLPPRVRGSDVNRAFQAAGVNWNDMINGDAPRRTLPAPVVLPSPSAKALCMEGQFSLNESEGTHCCMGRWAMNKGHLEASAKRQSLASAFDLRIKAEPSSFPCSGYYQSSFRVRHQRPRRAENIEEDELFLAFDRNSAGDWNAEGHGRNKYGSFTLMGRLYADRRLEVYRLYNTKTPGKRSDIVGAKAGGSRRHGGDHRMVSDGKRRVKNQDASGTESQPNLGSKRKAEAHSAKADKIAKTASAASPSATTQDVSFAKATVPLTVHEKQALSDGINRLDDNGLSRVYEISLARMPVGSSGDEGIELEIDEIDITTLRHLQGYIREHSERACP